MSARCASACLIAAQAVQVEADATANHANRVKWAKRVFADPSAAGQQMLRAVLAANNTATLAQINAAADATIQAAVNSSVDTLADGT